MATPEWFDRIAKKSSGRDLNKFRLLDSLYQESQAVKHDTFDAEKYETMYGEAEDMADVAKSRKIDNPAWPPIVQDAFLALWKARPDIRPAEDMRPSHILNQMTMDKIVTASDYEELRTWTKFDDWASAMGTVSLAEKLGRFYDENKDLREKQEKLAQHEQEILDTLEEFERAAEEGMSDEDIEEFLDDLEESLEELQEDSETLESAADAKQHQLRRAVQGGMKDALEETASAMDMVAGFGTEAGQWQRLDARTRMGLAQRLSGNRTLKEIAKMVGRMKRLAVGQWRRRVIHGVDEIYDVGIGNDLEHVLPSQLLYLADDDTEDIFYAKFLEGSLLTYQLRGTEKSAQGPIVVLLDSSGSMHGEREIWGKAVALSLLQIAKEEGRDFYGIHFGSTYDRPGEWHFKKGEMDLSEVLDYAEFFIGGGTDFEAPISRAVEIMETHYLDEGASRADLIMITDGECSVSKEWMDRFFNAKEEMAFRMYGILIGTHSPVLDTLSDELYTTRDIMSGNEVKEMFTYL